MPLGDLLGLAGLRELIRRRRRRPSDHFIPILIGYKAWPPGRPLTYSRT
jgi:hypothetical protein